MAGEQTLSLFHIGVEFHPDAIGNPSGTLFTFTWEDGQPLPNNQIPVPSGIGMIVFNLSTAPGSPTEALFQTSPVQWFATGLDGEATPLPIPTPGMFWVERAADQVVRLIDYNSNQSSLVREQTHWFNLVVAYDGNTYGADPSIVNEPPSPG